MAIIIIADTLEEPQSQTLPVGQKAQPAIEQPALKQPVQPSPPSGKTPPKEVSPVRQSFYDEINRLLAKYKQQPNDNIALKIMNLKLPEGAAAGQKIKDWLSNVFQRTLASKGVKVSPEEGETASFDAILSMLRNAEPGALTGYLISAIEGGAMHYLRKRFSGEKNISGNVSEGYGGLRDYFTFFLDPEKQKEMLSNPRKMKGKIDSDLLQKVNNGEMKPQYAAAEQHRRDKFNDEVVNPETGERRTQIAKDMFIKEYQSALSNTNPEVIKSILQKLEQEQLKRVKIKRKLPPITLPPIPFRNDREYFIARNILEHLNPQSVAKYDDKKSPLWLNGPMWDYSRVGEKGIDARWDHAKNELSGAGRQNVHGVEETPANISTEGPKFSDQAKKNYTVKDLLDSTYEDILSSFEDPEDQQIIEERMQLVRPEIAEHHEGIDSHGERVVNITTRKNPDFKRTIENIIENLYGAGSPQRMVGTRPVSATPDGENRTKELLYLIGMSFANRFDSTPTGYLDTNIDQQINSIMSGGGIYFQHIQPKNHTDMDNNRVYAFAVREIMEDVLLYLRDDENYNGLVQELRNKAAEFITSLKKFAFITIAKIIARG